MMVTARATPILLGGQYAHPPRVSAHPPTGPVRRRALGLDLDGVPGGVPVRTQMAGRCPDRRVIVGKSVGRPTYGSHGEHRARRGDDMGHAEHPDPTRWILAVPHPLQPPHQRDPARYSASCSMQGRRPWLAAYTTRRAAGLDLIRFHGQDQPAVRIILHIEYVHARNIKDRIGSCAPARTRTTHRVGHCRSFMEQKLGRL
jgi:hypothetical protein